MGKVEIELTEQDFVRICDRSAKWGRFEGGAARFENMTPGRELEDEYSHGWTYAYDAGETWASVILARAFLASVDEPCEILWDMDQRTHWVLTDYESSTWRKMREREQSGGE